MCAVHRCAVVFRVQVKDIMHKNIEEVVRVARATQAAKEGRPRLGGECVELTFGPAFYF